MIRCPVTVNMTVDVIDVAALFIGCSVFREMKSRVKSSTDMTRLLNRSCIQ